MKNSMNLRPERMIILIIILMISAFSSFANDVDCQCGDTMTQYKIWYLDSDGDGFGDMLNARIGCEQPFRYVDNCLDEDDTRSGNNTCSCMMVITEWFRDADGDGFGDPMNVQISPCMPEGYVADSTDADDTDEMIWFMNDEESLSINDKQQN